MSKKTESNIRILNAAPDHPHHSNGVEHEYMVISPDIAREMMLHNTRNRVMSTSLVDRYAFKMKEGKWRFCADPIRFDRKGTLIDGQHRLAACIKSDTAFFALVVRGLDPEIMDIIDTGKKRTAADALHLKGYPSSAFVGAVARWLLSIKNGGPNRRASRTFDNDDIIEIASRHPEIIDSVNKSYGAFGGGRRSLIATLHYVGAHLLDRPEEADSFLAVYTDGTAAYEGDPALIWREHCLRARKSGALMLWSLTYPNLVRAFNMHLDGVVMKGVWKIHSEDIKIKGLDLDKI